MQTSVLVATPLMCTALSRPVPPAATSQHVVLFAHPLLAQPALQTVARCALLLPARVVLAATRLFPLVARLLIHTLFFCRDRLGYLKLTRIRPKCQHT